MIQGCLPFSLGVKLGRRAHQTHTLQTNTSFVSRAPQGRATQHKPLPDSPSRSVRCQPPCFAVLADERGSEDSERKCHRQKYARIMYFHGGAARVTEALGGSVSKHNMSAKETHQHLSARDPVEACIECLERLLNGLVEGEVNQGIHVLFPATSQSSASLSSAATHNNRSRERFVLAPVFVVHSDARSIRNQLLRHHFAVNFSARLEKERVHVSVNSTRIRFRCTINQHFATDLKSLTEGAFNVVSLEVQQTLTTPFKVTRKLFVAICGCLCAEVHS